MTLYQALKILPLSDIFLKMNYYVFQVMTGEENKFIKLANCNALVSEISPDEWGRIIFPQRKLTIRKKGKQKEITSAIFKGYLFIELKDLTPNIYWLLKKTEGFIRFLKSNTNIQPIRDNDKKLILHFLSFGEIVEKSNVFFDEDNRIRVISGPMKGMEGMIIKVNRRKKRAKIKLLLYEESFKIDFGFEILAKLENHEKDKKQ